MLLSHKTQIDCYAFYIKNDFLRMTKTKTFLNVPFKEKDVAKNLGAQWDSFAKKWFTNNDVDLSLFEKWLDPKDQSFQNTLQSQTQQDKNQTPTKLLLIGLIPQSAWFSNLRSELTPDEWDQLRKKRTNLHITFAKFAVDVAQSIQLSATNARSTTCKHGFRPCKRPLHLIFRDHFLHPFIDL